ncbi:MAG: GDP-mannose 4,6-dehydratase, partial [Desulfobacterales bacterium]|nr:GDP-mannose 4,6-dehydratase [Desulfobacterales bacterium]
MPTIIVTGGAGFIGTNFIRHLLDIRPGWRIVNLDALTYAGNAANLADVAPARYRFVRGDIGDETLVRGLLAEERHQAVVNFAAESHVDRSIVGPLAFVETNVLATARLLLACRNDWEEKGRPADFRFLHVSTDEVFGSLG